MPTYYHFSLHIIQILWIVWLLIWFIAAFFTKKTIYRQNRWLRALFFLWIIIVLFFARPDGIKSTYLTHWFFFPTLASCILGCTLCALGLAFAVWARFHLGRNWSGLITLKENHELIQSGPYALVRHPIYTGILTAAAGAILALSPTPAGLFTLLALAIAFSLKLRGEEKLMARQFPDAYPAYKQKVRGAIIPWLL